MTAIEQTHDVAATLPDDSAEKSAMDISTEQTQDGTATLYQIWQTIYAGDFAQGVTLLATHNPGAVTRNIMGRFQKIVSSGKGLSRYEENKLSDALQKTIIQPGTKFPLNAATNTAGYAAAVDTPPPAADPAAPAALPAAPAAEAAAEPVLTSDAAKALHKEEAHLHALLTKAETDKARADLADQIMNVRKALDAEYDRLRAAQANPAPEAEAPLHSTPGPILNKADAADYKKLLSVRARITTLRNRLIPAAANDPKRKEKLEKELKAKLAERDRLEAKLK